MNIALSSRDLGLGLLVIVIFAANVVAIKFIVADLPPLTALAIRFVLTAACFLPFCKWPGRDKAFLIFQICLFMSVMHQGFLFWSMVRVDGTVAVILLQTQALFSTLIGWLWFKEKIGWRTCVGLLLGVCGVVVLVGVPANPPSLSGVVGMLLCTFTLSIAYARMKSLPSINPVTYIALLHLFASPFVIVLAFALERPLAIDWGTVSFWPVTLALAFQVIIVSLSHMLWQRLIARNAMSLMPNLVLLMPFFGILFSVWLLNESFTMAAMIGGALTMAGVGIIAIRRNQKHQKPLKILE